MPLPEKGPTSFIMDPNLYSRIVALIQPVPTQPVNGEPIAIHAIITIITITTFGQAVLL